MKTGINLNIDVSKIDKSLLYKGQKGIYLDATVFVNTEQDQYENNGMIVQQVSKEEKEAGKQGAILGNCKIFWTTPPSNDDNQTKAIEQTKAMSQDELDEELPL
jgi:hypothetical protein